MLAIYLLLFGSCIIGGVVAQLIETNICTGVEEGRSIPDYSDCSAFYRCNGGQPSHGTCLSGLRFNRVEERCTLFSQNACFRCPTGQVFIDVPVDNNCIQFVRCFANVARQQTCSDGLLFDPVQRQCNFERNVYCECPTLDIPGWPVMIRDPRNCANFRVCSAGVSLNHECREGLYFSKTLLQCDFPHRVNCVASAV